MRKRSPRWYSSPAKSSKSEPFAIVTTRPRGASPRVSSAIASETQTIASAERATSCATACSACSFVRTARLSARRCGCATSESRRSATQRDAGRPLRRRADQVHRARRRGRDHDVDPLAAHELDRGGDRGQVPAHVLVGNEQPAPEQARLAHREVEPGRAVQLLRRPAALGADEAGPVHPGLRRRRQLGVGVDPLRIVGREHVRLDPERGQVRRELQRSLHAAAARGREVERHEQHLHCAAIVRGGRCRRRRSPGVAIRRNQ